MKYLTEKSLKIYLDLIFPEVQGWICNKNFPNSRFRPDYRSDTLKIVVEFDGFTHYTSSKTILRDISKDKLIRKNGYKVVRIPMFIQMDSKIISLLFNKVIDVEQLYPHGFISEDSTLVLPADFCELGLRRFTEELEKFSCVKEDIVSSLKEKVKVLKDINLVLPPSLHYMLE